MTARRRWRIAVLTVIVAAVCLFHALLLRGLAGLLIVDQPTDDYDCVCISSWGYQPNGDRCYDVAAELYRRKPSCRILLVAPDANRLEEIGAMPSFESLSRRQLHARHVPQAAVSALHAAPWNDWATARRWPTGWPITPADACSCSAGNSIADKCAARWTPCSNRTPPRCCTSAALPSRECDDTNWWTRRCGYRAFAESWLLRLQSRPSDDAAKTPEKSGDDYERDFLHAFSERAP